MTDVIVTGGNGFVGSHVVRYFRGMGHKVFAPSREHFDLRYAHAASALFETGPANPVVIHCAAVVGGIGANQRLPAQFLEDNVLINTNVVVQARRHNCRKIVALGSVCGYPHTPERIPFVERDFFGDYPEATNAPYGYTKRLLLMQLYAEAQQYGLNWSYLIPTNMYGPGDNFDPGSSHVVPALIRKFHKACGPVWVWGSGAASRDFLYVADACEAIYRAAMSKDDLRFPINLGSGEETTIADLVDLIIEVTGYEGEIHYDSSKPDGQPRRVLDITVANDMLKWMPKVSLETGIDAVLNHWMEVADD